MLRQLLAPPVVDGSWPMIPSPDLNLVGAICGMFSSLNPHIMYESLELAMCMLSHDSTSLRMIKALDVILRPEVSPDSPSLESPSFARGLDGKELPGYHVSQAAAARVRSSLTKKMQPNLKGHNGLKKGRRIPFSGWPDSEVGWRMTVTVPTPPKQMWLRYQADATKSHKRQKEGRRLLSVTFSLSICHGFSTFKFPQALQV